MILIDNTIVSEDIADKFFVCDLSKCKGACCVEGDLGAPLEVEELTIITQEFENFKSYMTPQGLKAVDEQGLFINDWEGDYSTPTIADKECAYALYDEKGVLKCAIEQAYLDGKTSFQKPISCHLYPIRITKTEHYDAINYDKWHICNDACSHGKSLGVPLYKFLKAPLTRKYGEAWYQELQKEIEG